MPYICEVGRGYRRLREIRAADARPRLPSGCTQRRVHALSTPGRAKRPAAKRGHTERGRLSEAKPLIISKTDSAELWSWLLSRETGGREHCIRFDVHSLGSGSCYGLGLPGSGLLWISDGWGGWCRSSGRRPLKVPDAARSSWTLLSTVWSLCWIRRSRSRCQSAGGFCGCAGPVGRRSWGSMPLAARQTATSPMSSTSR
jgi:hypothetical protein